MMQFLMSRLQLSAISCSALSACSRPRGFSTAMARVKLFELDQEIWTEKTGYMSPMADYGCFVGFRPASCGASPHGADREALRGASQARFERLKRRVLVSVGAEGKHGRVMIGGDKEVCGQDSRRKLVERLGATNHPDRKRWPA